MNMSEITQKQTDEAKNTKTQNEKINQKINIISHYTSEMGKIPCYKCTYNNAKHFLCFIVAAKPFNPIRTQLRVDHHEPKTKSDPVLQTDASKEETG